MEHASRNEKQLGAVIRQCRKKVDLTQAQLGAIVCKRQATISELESGKTGTNLETLFSILNALEFEMVVRPRRKGDVHALGDLF